MCWQVKFISTDDSPIWYARKDKNPEEMHGDSVVVVFFFKMNAYSALITSHRVTCMFNLFIGAPRKELEGYGCFRQSGKICLRKN